MGPKNPKTTPPKDAHVFVKKKRYLWVDITVGGCFCFKAHPFDAWSA